MWLMKIAAVAALSSLIVSLSPMPAFAGPPEKHLLYVTMPGTYYGGGAPGMIVFDIDQGHRFVKRIKTPDFGQQTKGFCASLASKRMYVSSTKKLWCFDIIAEKIVWEKEYETGCDRMAITPD